MPSWPDNPRILARISVICGGRDSGKTSTAAALATALQAQGHRVGGVLAEAVLSQGVKTDYSLVDLATGNRSLYARQRQGPIQRGVLRYEFLSEGLQFGCAAIRRAAAEGVDALLVDEIGPLEAAGGGLWEPCREILAGFSGRIVFTVRPALLDWLLERPGMSGEEVAVIAPEKAADAP
jgi:nucleoside-triphosphatase THEP1